MRLSSSSRRRCSRDADAAAAESTSWAQQKVLSRFPRGGGGPAARARCCTTLLPRVAAAPISSAGVTWPRARAGGWSAPPPARAVGVNCAGVLRSAGRVSDSRRRAQCFCLPPPFSLPLQRETPGPCFLPPPSRPRQCPHPAPPPISRASVSCGGVCCLSTGDLVSSPDASWQRGQKRMGIF